MTFRRNCVILILSIKGSVYRQVLVFHFLKGFNSMNKDKETINQDNEATKPVAKRHKAFTVIGIILCVILIPVLVINVTMIIKSYTNPDEYPMFAGYTMMIVLSPSMEDTIMTGDLILVKKAEPEDIKGESAKGAQDGDIISFFDPDSEKQSVLTHRCVEVTKDKDGSLAFKTKGDNNVSEDLSLAPAKNLIGTYITRIPGAGNIAMWLQTTPGLIVCVAVPIVLLVAYDLIMKKRYDKNKKKDTDALLAELESLRAQQAESENAEEAKADAANEQAAQAQAEKKTEEPKKEPKSDDSETAEKPEEKQSETPAEPKAEEKAGDDSAVPAGMTAEELEEFREFQRMKKAKMAAESKDEEKPEE